MASFVLTDTEVFAGALDATCFTNTVTLESSRDVVDATTFCSGGWRTSVAGLLTWTATLGGPQDLVASSASTTYTPDEYYALDLGSAYPLSFVPQGAAVGSVAYLGEGRLNHYSPVAGAVGDLAVQTSDWSITSTPLVRGVLAVQGTYTVPGVQYTTAQNIGAVSAAQRVWCAVHILTRGGTGTLSVELISDDNAGFTSPTTRTTFTAISSRTAEIKSVAGAITDTYWGLSLNVAGGSPSFQVRSTIGIQ